LLAMLVSAGARALLKVLQFRSTGVPRRNPNPFVYLQGHSIYILECGVGTVIFAYDVGQPKVAAPKWTTFDRSTVCGAQPKDDRGAEVDDVRPKHRFAALVRLRCPFLAVSPGATRCLTSLHRLR
jgi:hypothetical protein